MWNNFIYINLAGRIKENQIWAFGWPSIKKKEGIISWTKYDAFT